MEETVYSLLDKIEREHFVFKEVCETFGLKSKQLDISFNRIENYIEEIKSLINEEISLKED